MTKDKALKLALEALETSARNWPSDSVIEAITAIKEALAHPEQEPVVMTKTWFEDGKVVTQHLTAKEIYKKPEQEPVTKPYAYEYGQDNGDGTYTVVIKKGDLGQIKPAVYDYVRPKNAHKDWPIKELFDRPQPAQREWVGLTDKQRLEIADDSASYRMVLATEAKLKEKNT